MKIQWLKNIKEGRRIEFKSTLPENSDLAKTVVAFANDAGGEIYIGIDDSHQIVGVPEDSLMPMEEQVSNMIYDRCYPTILPEVTFLTIENKHIIKVKIYKGSMPPYYLKSEGKIKGTYIRVGSNNRVADNDILGELERKRRDVSFDGEIVLDKELEKLDISGFIKQYKEKTEEELTFQVLRKLELVKDYMGAVYPTNALVLFSDDALRESMFPNAKIECARFKGTSADEFIDQKTVMSHIGTAG